MTIKWDDAPATAPATAAGPAITWDQPAPVSEPTGITWDQPEPVRKIPAYNGKDISPRVQRDALPAADLRGPAAPPVTAQEMGGPAPSNTMIPTSGYNIPTNPLTAGIPFFDKDNAAALDGVKVPSSEVSAPRGPMSAYTPEEIAAETNAHMRPEDRRLVENSPQTLPPVDPRIGKPIVVPPPPEINQNWATANVNTAFNKMGQDPMAWLKPAPSHPNYMTDDEARAEQQKRMQFPVDPKRNVLAGEVVGGAVKPLIAGAVGGPVGAAAYMGAEGMASAAEEGHNQDYTPAQTAGLMATRGAGNFVGGMLLPGGGGNVAKQAAKGAALMYGQGVTQAGVESAAKQGLGIQTSGVAESMKDAATSPEVIANAAIGLGHPIIAHAIGRAVELTQRNPDMTPAQIQERVQAEVRPSRPPIKPGEVPLDVSRPVEAPKPAPVPEAKPVPAIEPAKPQTPPAAPVAEPVKETLNAPARNPNEGGNLANGEPKPASPAMVEPSVPPVVEGQGKPPVDKPGDVAVTPPAVQPAPDAASPAPAKVAETPSPSRRRSAVDILGERYEGSPIGSKTKSMFGDMSEGAANELEAQTQREAAAARGQVDKDQMRLADEPLGKSDEMAGPSPQGPKPAPTWTDKVSAARERLKAKGSIKERLKGESGSLDLQDIADMAVIGADYIKKGAHSFADFSKKMVDDVGELLQSDLQRIYQHVRNSTDYNDIHRFMDDNPENQTGIKNAVVDEALEKMGMAPAEHGQSLTRDKVLEDVAATVKADPFAGRKLMAQLKDNQRPVTAHEDMLLIHEQTRLGLARDAAEQKLADAINSGDTESIAEAKALVSQSRTDYQTAADVVTKAGTMNAQGLAFRREMMKDDFSLAAVERRDTIAKGKPLTEAELADAKAFSKKAQEIIAARDKTIAEQGERLAHAHAERDHANLLREAAEKSAVEPHIRTIAERIIAKLDSAASSAEARIKARGIRVNAGFDPIAFADEVIVGSAQIAKGAVKLADFSAAMVKKLGDYIKPHLEDLHKASTMAFDKEIGSLGSVSAKVKNAMQPKPTDMIGKIKARQADGANAADLQPYLRGMALELIRGGVKTREPLLDAMHEQMKTVFPEIKRSEVRDILSGYGDFKPLDMTAEKVTLRDIQQQSQKLAQLDALNKGKAPEKTGVQRQPPNDETRALTNQVNDAKKAAGIVTTDPATQLKTALDSMKTRAKNAIKDLQTEIDTGHRTVKGKRIPIGDAELVVLKERLAEVRKAHAEIFEKPGLTDEQRRVLATKAAVRTLQDLQTKAETIKKGGYSKEPSAPKITGPEIDALRAQIAAARAEYVQLRNADPTYKASADDATNQAYRTSLAHREADIRARMAKDDYAPREKPGRKHPLDEASIAAESEYQKLKTRDAMRRRAYELRNRTVMQKVGAAALEPLNISKAIKSAYDLSAPLRQGAVFTFGHPILSAGNTLHSIGALGYSAKGAKDAYQQGIKGVLKYLAYGNDSYARRLDTRIRTRDGHKLGESAKLELTTLGDDIGPHEEAIRSSLSDYVPGIAQSNRAFTTFLNLQRSQIFDIMAASAPKSTPAEARALAHFVNVASGRGEWKALEPAMRVASSVIWSPKLLLSRFQLLTGQSMVGGTARTRKLIAKEYARSLVGLGAFYGAVQLAGMAFNDDKKPTVELDPRSADFGKVKMGNTRLDPLAGLGQVTRLVSTVVSGEKKTASGKIVPIRGENVPYKGDTTSSTIGRFLQTKLSPTISTPLNFLSGSDAVGKPVTASSAAADLVTPLSLGDIYGVMLEQGVPKGTAISLISIFGMGLQQYEFKHKSTMAEQEKAKIRREMMGSKPKRP